METVALGLFLFSCIALTWLFYDSLHVRNSLSTILKMIGSICMGLTALLQLMYDVLSVASIDQYLMTTALFLFYLGFIYDDHAKFPGGLIIMILSLFFVRGNVLLIIQASTVSIVILQMAYTTTHHDFIPLGIGFVLIAIGEFFQFYEGIFSSAATLMYLFVALSFFYWMGQYILPRLRLRFGTPQSLDNDRNE